MKTNEEWINLFSEESRPGRGVSNAYEDLLIRLTNALWRIGFGGEVGSSVIGCGVDCWKDNWYAYGVKENKDSIKIFVEIKLEKEGNILKKIEGEVPIIIGDYSIQLEKKIKYRKWVEDFLEHHSITPPQK